jgi:hypothetical protein
LAAAPDLTEELTQQPDGQWRLLFSYRKHGVAVTLPSKPQASRVAALRREALKDFEYWEQYNPA